MRSGLGPSTNAGTTGRLLVLLAVGTVLVAACAPGPPTQRQESASAVQPAIQRTKTLRIDNRKENTTGVAVFSTNNAWQMQTAWTFHAGLTAFDAQGNLQGRVARKVPSVTDSDWKVNPDGTMEVTWKLRPNVKWHDGTPLTAADFVFGIQIAADRELPLQSDGGVRLIAGATSPDAETLVVRWSEPFFSANQGKPDNMPAVPRHLLQDLYQQLDKATFAKLPYWTTEFVGLGPYRLARWELGSFTEGLAFDAFFLGRPRIDRVIIRYSYDPNVSLAALLSGDLDLAAGGLSAQDLENLKHAWEPQGDGTLIQSVGSVDGAIWQWRDPAAPWVGDLRVRQALLHLIDRQAWADTFEPGGRGVADLFAAPGDPVYRIAEQRGFAKYPYDPAKGAALLAESGWTRGADGMLQNRTGQHFTLEVRVQGDSPPSLFLVDQWKRGGLEVPFTVISPQAADRMKQKAQSQGIRMGGGSISDDWLVQFTTAEIRSEANNWAGLNQGGYSNPAVDQLYEQYRRELDPGRRNTFAADFMKKVADEVLQLPWIYGSESMAFRRGIRGPTVLQPVQLVATYNIHEWDMD